jgi:hypothetical protein
MKLAPLVPQDKLAVRKQHPREDEEEGDADEEDAAAEAAVTTETEVEEPEPDTEVLFRHSKETPMG